MSGSSFTTAAHHHYEHNEDEAGTLGFVYDHNDNHNDNHDDKWIKSIREEHPDDEDVVIVPGITSTEFDNPVITRPPEHMKECISCENRFCSEPIGVVEHCISLLAIKVLGVIFITLSVMQFFLGQVIFHSVLIERHGNWWAGFFAFYGGICALVLKTRGWVRAVATLASITIILSTVGAALDGRAAVAFNGLVACTTGNIIKSNVLRYGDRNYYSKSDTCFEEGYAKNNLSAGRCYCVTAANSICHIYQPASFINCGTVLNTNPKLLITSTTLCSLIALCAWLLAIGSCMILCCSDKSIKCEASIPCDIIPGDTVGDGNGDEVPV